MDLCAYPPTLGEHTGVALMGGRDIHMEAVRQAVSPHLRSDPATCVACGSVVGIYDVSCFTKCFKKQIGLSQMKYKQQFRQKSEKS